MSTYDETWRVTLKASELFKHDFPSGRMPTPLPQFRSSYRDPIREHYEDRAAKELGIPYYVPWKSVETKAEK